MTPIFLFLFLVLIAGLSLLPTSSDRFSRILGIVGGLGTAIGVAFLIYHPFVGNVAPQIDARWAVDQFSSLLCALIGLLYLSASLVSYRYIAQEYAHGLLTLRQVRLYYVCLPLFILSMLVTVLANNIGILWLGLEATTLATTFLVAIYLKEGAVEAAWKYIILCSTGIALGLLGILMIHHAGIGAGLSVSEALQLSVLGPHASDLPQSVMRWAFVFIFIGFGTKVGFVPLHSWLPDAHSKTPSPISALLSGVLLNVAFYAILRFKFLTDGSLGDSAWTEHFFLVFGFISILIPTFLIVIQKNYKRLLAYSSIEHMGLTAFAIGLGPFGIIPALMHMVGHSLTKSALFFGAGEFLLSFRTTKIALIGKTILRQGKTSVLFLVAILALLAVPPSALFGSEFLLIGYGMTTFKILTLLVLVCLTIIAASMLRHAVRMIFEEVTEEPVTTPILSEETSSSLKPEPWNITHAVMIGHGILLFAVGYFFLTQEGLRFMASIAQHLIASV